MKIHQEYIERHNLKTKVPPHVKTGALMLRFEEDGKINWIVTKIVWDHEPLYRIGKYKIDVLKPVSGRYMQTRNGNFKSILNEKKIVFWDQLNGYLENWTKEVDSNYIVKGEKEVELVAWEMFIHCNDEIISKTGFHDELFATIDPRKSIEERYNMMKSFMKKIERTGLLDSWKMEFFDKIVRNYLHWVMDFNGN